MVYEAIRELVRYGLEKGLITEDDAIYARNQILEVLKMDEYEEPEKDGELTGGRKRTFTGKQCCIQGSV